MKSLKSNKGFTLIEMLLALALLGILSVAVAAVLVTGIKILGSSTKLIQNTNTAAGQVDNWYADHNQSGTTSTANGTFRVNFSDKGTYINQDGQYVTGKGTTSSDIAQVKTFEPNNAMTEPIIEAIIAKDTLYANANINFTASSNIKAKKVVITSGKAITSDSVYNSLYSDVYPFFSYRFYCYPYKQVRTPIPVAANTTYVDYTGTNLSFNVGNGNVFYYVNNFIVAADGIITVTNNSGSTAHKSVFIYIKGAFSISTAKQLQINFIGSSSNYTSLYFVYCGNDSIYLDGNIGSGASASRGIYCNAPGCFIYAPSADVALIATGLSGVLATNVTINGTTSFSPVISSSTKPNWKDLVLKLIGS